LDIFCHPPDNIEMGMAGYDEYARLKCYLAEQNLEPLEHKRWRLKIGDSCNKRGKVTLQLTDKREDTRTRKIEDFRCDYCASEIANQRVESHDTLYFADTWEELPTP
jgi:hypothetical protein